MSSMIKTRTFIEGCLDENQTKTFERMVERIDPSFRAWAEKQHQILEVSEVSTSVLADTLDKATFIDGLICEFGVCTGNSTNLIAKHLPDREVFGFDSFEGFPADWNFGDKRVPKEWLAVDPSRLVFADNVRLVKGFFDASLPPFLSENDGKMAMMHVDCDTYQSTVDILTQVRPRLQKGTLIVFDEILGDMGLENEMLALWEQLILNGFEFEWLRRGGNCWTAETQKRFKAVKNFDPLYTLKLAFYNPRAVLSHLTNKKKVENAQCSAAIKITKLP